MACGKRQRTGICDHFQCPLSNKTKHGFECVEIFDDNTCDAGDDCLEECPYSFVVPDDEKN